MRKPIAVEAYTATHQIRGNVLPGTTGLFSYMNMPTESSLEVEEADVSLLYQVGQAADHWPRVWLVKEEIVAVLVHSLGELGPSSAVRSGYTKPFPHLVRVMVGGYEARGLVHGGGRFDFRAMMFEGESRFLPLFDAHLTALLFPKLTSHAPALLFNRKMVTAVSQIAREPTS